MTRKKLMLVSGLVAAVLVGAVGAHAATTYTAPKDHAQAFVTTNQFNQWVAQRQVGFTNVENPANGWCFTLPATANPSKSVPVVTINTWTSPDGLRAQAAWHSQQTTRCPNSNQIEIVTGYDNGSTSGPFSHITNESFSIVVP